MNSMISSVAEKLRVQQGGKILQFITQYEFKRNEMRSLCPINPFSGSDRISLQNHDQFADLLAQLNEDLVKQGSSTTHPVISVLPIETKKIPQKEEVKGIPQKEEVKGIPQKEEVKGKTVSQAMKKMAELQVPVANYSSSEDESDYSIGEMKSYHESGKNVSMPKIVEIAEEDQSAIDTPIEPNLSPKSMKSSQEGIKQIGLSKHGQRYKSGKSESGVSKTHLQDRTVEEKQSVHQCKEGSSIGRKESGGPSWVAKNMESVVDVRVSDGGDSGVSRIQNTQEMDLMKLAHLDTYLTLLKDRYRRSFQVVPSTVSRIRSITWDSLQMPTATSTFKKFDYAPLLN